MLGASFPLLQQLMCQKFLLCFSILLLGSRVVFPNVANPGPAFIAKLGIALEKLRAFSLTSRELFFGMLYAAWK
ncbi:MAG: hypothetical protein A2038_05555 [Deltaproteobacteria bacterium GWA2_57_13]|nr:MAG: hypothetical protein A2038_05555 [Deltaproteobacteria bacterium GWA2_57_13]OGQ52508.1 MAG: hypothetical protein A3I10_01800 [Deltaproteobacteria bacterium RIFCSPLOWO2_02_FULL_57_26]OGQ84344.1 MAG: hypothetical protein A3G40_09630 [Deltaproteobacteria bacterium RIFCSPLOWO2_12_FULL_57_22]